MKKSTLVHAACLLACSAYLPVTQAQSAQTAPSMQSSSTPEVMVTASRTEQLMSQALSSSSLITRADIERAQTSDLPTLLRTVAGVEFDQYGGAGTASSLRLRGAESRHTLVLVDGIPINTVTSGQAGIESIPVSNIERIEIVRGNVSSLYGSAALGGVIQIFTREGSNKTYTNASVRIGSGGFGQASASVAYQTDSKLRLSASIDSLSDKGINALNQADNKYPTSNPDIDGTKRRSYAVGVRQSFDDGHIGLNVRSTYNKTQYDSDSGTSTQIDESKSLSQAITLEGKYRIKDDWSIAAALTRSVEKSKDEGLAAPYEFNNVLLRQALSTEWQAAKGSKFVAGIEREVQQGDSVSLYSEYREARTLMSKRVSYLFNSPSIDAQLALRQDHYSSMGSVKTWLLSSAYRVGAGHRLIASTSTGFNAPHFGQLYCGYFCNPSLRAESVASTEVGYQFSSNAHDLRITRFSNRYQDLIVGKNNVDKAKNSGWEWAQRSKYGDASMNLGMTVQSPVNETTGEPLILRAKQIFSIGVAVPYKGVDLGANYRKVGERLDTFYDPSAGYTGTTKILPSYRLLDLTASYPLSKQTKLIARLDNALNTRYETIYGYNQLGRRLTAGLTWQM